MKISVFGVGYVGLVTAICFAEMGNDVVCVDIEKRKIAKLNEGKSPIYEPGLEELLRTNLKEGRIQFTTDAELAVQKSNLIFIAVGTPSDKDGSADLKYVMSVAETIANHMNEYKVIINKSTVPVGTIIHIQNKITELLKCNQKNFEFDVVSNPEFLKEGTAIEDCLKPSRVIIGAESQRSKQIMHELYEPFVKSGNPIIFMDCRSSELTKYAANAMLATKISFMNELSRLCEKVGADIEQVRIGIGSDPRIGHQFIFPGIGFGGSCFPKDVKALVKMGSKENEELHILSAVEKVNQLQQERFVEQVLQFLGKQTGISRVAIWGIAFKPGTDDIREAPALYVIQRLLHHGVKVIAYDPIATENAKNYFGSQNQLIFSDTLFDALKDADALCIITEWKSFREPDFDKMKTLMKKPVIFDGRNLYNPTKLAQKGFQYFAIGRPKI